MFSVLVVGGGPAGLQTAIECQARGWETVVIEEHPEIGKPVNCTGIISRTGVEEHGIDLDGILVNSIKGARVFSPSGEMLEVRRKQDVAYIVDRAGLDRQLAKQAENAGAKIYTRTKLLNIRNESIFVEREGRGELLKAKIVVGADGPNSMTRQIMGMRKTRDDFVHAYQVRVEGNYDPSMVGVYLGPFAKNFFGWVAPEKKEWARAGIATSELNVRSNFELFMTKMKLSGNYCDECSALIPVGSPMKDIVSENIMLAGDAAFHTKATTGGGILASISAGKAAAKAIDSHLKHKKPLKEYLNHLKPLYRELELHWKIRKYMNSFSDREIDSMFLKMRKAGIERFLEQHGDMDRPSLFVNKLVSNPGMWRMLPEILKFMRS